jgi:hypothetical protein
MKSKMIVVLLVSLLAIPLLAHAQSGGGYELTRSAIGGGDTSNGGGYSLAGTVGQADTGALSGGGYSLNSGFWNDLSGPYQVYLPLVLR